MLYDLGYSALLLLGRSPIRIQGLRVLRRVSVFFVSPQAELPWTNLLLVAAWRRAIAEVRAEQDLSVVGLSMDASHKVLDVHHCPSQEMAKDRMVPRAYGLAEGCAELSLGQFCIVQLETPCRVTPRECLESL